MQYNFRSLKNHMRALVQFSRSVVSDSLRPHESQHARPPCPSPTPGVHPNSRPLSRWCHPAISFSVVPFSSCPQSLPESESFPMSQLFAWGGQSTGVSASTSVLPMNTQDWSPLGWTGWTPNSYMFSKILNIMKIKKIPYRHSEGKKKKIAQRETTIRLHSNRKWWCLIHSGFVFFFFLVQCLI